MCMPIAHISDDGRHQSVDEHSHNVAEMASQFASDFNCADEAYQIGLIHDLGKTSKEFQNRILHNGNRCDHSSAGAYELMKSNDIIGSIAVLGHHTGLPDLGSKADSIADSTWFGRMRKADQKLIPKYHMSDTLARKQNIKLDFASAFKTRMLYSCLVDADFLDTEQFMYAQQREYNYDTINDLRNKFYEYIKKWNKPKSEIDKIRSEILQNCLSKGTVDKGLYSLTVPTGGGKTTSSLGFAIEHAVHHQMKRVIYIIPYTNIIEQNAQVARNVLDAKNILEHHSGYDGHASDEFDKEQLAAENWDAPIIVTTAVRFFEAIYANKSSRCRRLHNIANSVLIFDEAQCIPLEHLKPCTAAINELVTNYNCTAVLCTATCPALDKLFTDKTIIELQENKDELYKKLQRTRFEIIEETFDAKKIANKMTEYNQVLCIVNTRQAAKDIYDLLPTEGRYHLSTLMYPSHRRQVLNDIKTRLLQGKTVRLISTSLIEAGVDVDFPVVMRENAGLDSIQQAAGRCNREGKRKREDSIVYIFEREGKIPSSLRQTIGALHEVMCGYRDSLDSLEAIDAYFKSLYRFTGEDNMDVDNVVSAFSEHTPCPFPFKTVAERFHYIHGETYTVYIATQQSQHLINQIINGNGTREIYRELGQYSVSLYKPDFDNLCQAGYIQIYNDDFAVVDANAIYSQETGLQVNINTKERK